MNTEYVYLVQCSSGSWDSHHKWIAGAFDEESKAFALMSELNDEAEAVKAKAPPKEAKEYMTYLVENETLMEWKEPKILAFPLNERNWKLD
jgi:hypothetical protein